MIKKIFIQQSFSVAGLLLFTAISFSHMAFAQNYQPYLNIPVTQFGNTIVNPWTGGLDTPIPQVIDLNGDGIKDLFVFEKGGAPLAYNRYSTFINNGTAGTVDYHYAPEYKNCFPPGMHGFVLLVDFDCDGREDIFTYTYDWSAGGMSVFHNDYTPGQGLKFSLYMNLIYSDYYGFNTNLYVASVNQPALVDVDNDSDLDVLTFAIASNTVEYHRNYGMELFGRCDTLIYFLEKACWGKFCLNSLTNTATLNCPAPPINSCANGPNRVAHDPGFIEELRQMREQIEKTELHSGSCMIAPDLDGDLDKDLINGDLIGNNLLYLMNGWNTDSALIVSQDTLFPVYNVPADFRIFPGPYYFDADNDGNKDLIVSGCIANATRNFKNVLFYKNTTNNTTNVFAFQQDDLLVGEMIDVGSGANVTLYDADGDGLEDMIIGNYIYIGQLPANDYTAVAYYRNTGTATQPSFNLVTQDYLNLSAVGDEALAPTFGDLDGDGDKDMILGLEFGSLIHYLNTAGPGNPAVFVQVSGPYLLASNGNPINIGSNSIPLIVDLNRDGKNDLVIGEKTGNLNYYQNTGTVTVPAFTYVTNNLGGINVTDFSYDIYGYSAPFVYDSAGYYHLYVGSRRGYVYKYDNIDGNLAGNFNLVDSIFLNEPIHSTVTGTDINNDSKLDLLVGNYAGGVTWYASTTVSVNELSPDQPLFTLNPNPASQLLSIRFNNSNSHEIIISDMLGRTVYSKFSRSYSEYVHLQNFSNGMYVCKVVEDQKVFTVKFIVQH